MTGLQAAGAGICAFMVWWNATLIRSARRQRRWFGAEARFLSPSRWGTRWQLGFVLPDGTEIITSTSIDGDAPRPAPGGAVVIVYDPDRPERCEPAITAGEIAVLRLIGFAAMAGGVVTLVWG